MPQAGRVMRWLPLAAVSLQLSVTRAGFFRCVGAMGRGFSWSPAEDEELCRLVRAYGCHWARIASSGFLPWRSAHALRGRWADLRVSPPVVESGAPAVVPLLSSLLVPGSVSPLAFNQGRALSRCSSAGRPWDFIVRHSRGVGGIGTHPAGGGGFWKAPPKLGVG